MRRRCSSWVPWLKLIRATDIPASISSDRQPSERPTGQPAPTDGFAVHVASFLDSERARRQIEILQDLGFPAFSRLQTIRGQEWERVYAGPYVDRDAVREAGRNLRLNGFPTYARIVDLGS